MQTPEWKRSKHLCKEMGRHKCDTSISAQEGKQGPGTLWGQERKEGMRAETGVGPGHPATLRAALAQPGCAQGLSFPGVAFCGQETLPTRRNWDAAEVAAQAVSGSLNKIENTGGERE